MVKKTKVSKPVASTRRLKKFDGGGTNKLKEFTDPGLKGYPGPEYGDTESTTNPKVVAPVVEPVVEPVVAPVVAATSPKVAQVKKNTVAKTKLLPGGFKSEAQRKAYTESLRQKIKTGKSVDQLVKEGYGTKKGLSDLGLGKYSEGLDLKKKGQAKKAEGLALKNKAKNTDYKKQWNENLLNKAATNKNLTRKESTYIRQKYKGNTNILGKKTDGTSKEKLAYKNAGNQQFEKVKPEMRENLEIAVSMTNPRGIAKQAVKKGGEFLLTEGAKKLIGQGSKQIASKGSQKLLGEGAKNVAKTGSKALKPDKIIKPTTKALNSGKKITINVSGRTVSSGSQKALNSGQKLLGEGAKNVAKTGSKALKPDKIIKPTTKALNSGQKMLGRTINVSGRTVSSGSQKALNSGQKLLNNGQTKLNASQKLLQQGSKVSKSTAAKVNQVAKNKSLARNTKNAKVRNAKPKPGDQLKLDLKRGGGKFSYGRNSKKK